MRLSLIPALALLTVLGGEIAADIAPPAVFSESIEPRSPTNIRMESEEVTVWLSPSRSRVHAVFHLRNLGDAETLEVGFPDITRGPDYAGNKGLADLTVSVDGRAVATVFRAERPLVKRPPSTHRWHVWTMRFARGQTHTVEVRYGQPCGYPYRHGLLEPRYFKYALETGAEWRGTIGRAKITVRLVNLTEQHLIRVSPWGSTFVDGVLVWEMTELEPISDHNIRIEYGMHRSLRDRANALRANTKAWDEAWIGAWICNTRLEDFALAERLVTGGFEELATQPEHMPRAKPDVLAWQEAALHQQRSVARFRRYVRSRTPERAEAVRAALRDLREAVGRAMKNPDVQRVVDTQHFETGLAAWLLTQRFQLTGSWKDFVWWMRHVRKRIERALVDTPPAKK